MVAEKIAAFQVNDPAGAEVLRMLVDLHRDITEPTQSPAPQESTQDTQVDPKVMAMAHWLVKLASMQVESGITERHYTMPELLAQCPPIPTNTPNPRVSLGQRLAIIAGHPIAMAAGRQAVIVPMRSANARGWLLQVTQAM
jgi:hypothetical protein